jgi:hypothetical protein
MKIIDNSLLSARTLTNQDSITEEDENEDNEDSIMVMKLFWTKMGFSIL